MAPANRPTVKRVDALVLYCGDLDVTAAFYRAIGITLEDEVHEAGPRHLAAELGPVHFALYAASSGDRAPGRHEIGAGQVGFQVNDVDAALDAAVAAGGTVLLPADSAPWGRRAVVEDPDGRPVELNCAV